MKRNEGGQFNLRGDPFNLIGAFILMMICIYVILQHSGC